MVARCSSAAIAALAVALAVPTTASAANVQALDTSVAVSGDPGEQNQIAITAGPTSGTLRIQDFVSPMRAGFGCTQIDQGIASARHAAAA